MAAKGTFSNPVLVAEGVAFCVSLPQRQKAVAIATTALLRVVDDEKRLAAFQQAAEQIHEAACHLILQGAASPVFIELHHLPAPMPLPSEPQEHCAVAS